MPTQLCPNCDARLDEPRRFCPECGAVIAAGAAPPRGAGRLLWVVLAGVAAVGLLLLLSCGGLLLITLGGGLTSPIAAPTATLAEATAAPTVAAGGGIIALPTPPPASTSAGVGSLLLYDDFADPQQSALIAEADEISSAGFADGGFMITVNDTDTLAWSLTDRTYSGLVIEAVASFTPGAEAIVAAGLIFNYQDSRNFYLFSVSNDGYYALELLEDDEWQTLIDWTESDLISPSHNTLRVEASAGRITLKVNGDLLEATDDDALRVGDAGLAVSSFDSGQVQVLFDNLLITRSP